MDSRRRALVCVLDDWDGVVGSMAAIAKLRGVADVLVLGQLDDSEVVAAAKRAQVLIPMRERRQITASLIDQLPNLQHIAQTGGGAAHIDLQAAERRGIGVSLTPGASAISVAELVIAGMLIGRRGLVDAISTLRDGAWRRPLGRELAGATLGILGFGATGRAVAERGRALGMRVLVTSRRSDDLDGYTFVEMDALFERSDIVSVHLEMSPATTGLVRPTNLAALGPSGMLINAARAGIVDSADLLRALDAGELGGAVLDVFDEEPPTDLRLIEHQRVIAIPHLGWRTEETIARYIEAAIENVIRHLSPNDMEKADGNA